MADYFEITFEDVDNALVNKLIGFLLGYAEAVYKAGDEGGNNIKDTMIAYDFQGNVKESSEMLALNNFSINASMVIPLVFLRVFGYGEKIDVEISFASSDIEWVDRVMCSAKEFSTVLSQKFGIKNIYAGMEPSS